MSKRLKKINIYVWRVLQLQDLLILYLVNPQQETFINIKKNYYY